MRGMPSGVGKGVGSQETLVPSTVEVFGVGLPSDGESGIIAMAVSIDCAITQPTIFSLVGIVVGRRNRYAFELFSIGGDSGEEDRARLTVSSRVVSCKNATP
jgi:hypothetical protein